MAGRFWKWRMQGGAIELAHQTRAQIAHQPAPDIVLATDMVNLPQWWALTHRTLPPQTLTVLYMHENQLTYPWPEGERRDLSYAMINWSSQLCADGVVFNSHFHRESWFDELPRLLKHFPDYNRLDLIPSVTEKALVLPVGIEFAPAARRSSSAGKPPLILWNQRWEYDKRPDLFFRLLYELQEEGVPFRLAIAGENFRRIPTEFDEAKERLSERIIHWGFVPDRGAYQNLLEQADLVISTADHEFFGISILEAIGAGAFPILPQKLSYPELIPTALHPACLYDDARELAALTRTRLLHRRPPPPSLQQHVRTAFGWQPVSSRYDDYFDELVLNLRQRHA